MLAQYRIMKMRLAFSVTIKFSTGMSCSNYKEQDLHSIGHKSEVFL